MKASILLLTILFTFRMNAETVFPGKTWEEASPESQGVNPEFLEKAMAHLEDIVHEDGTSQTMVIRHGRVIWKGEHTQSWHNVFSCTKSIFSITAGLLVDDGKLKPDTPLAEFVPELKPVYPEFNIRGALSLTSGYSAEKAGYPFEPAEPYFPEGEKMKYGGEALNMAAYALAVAAEEPLAELFKRRIGKPIGIQRMGWAWGDYGLVNGHRVNNGSGSAFKGVHAHAENLARVGLLLLNNGNWDGKQLLSEEWIQEARRPQSDPDIPLHDENGWYKVLQGSYGLGFWLNSEKADGSRLWPDAPDDTYAIQGNRNNICFILPEWDMVFIRLGTDRNIDVERYTEVFRLIAEAVDTAGK